jgi:hypothetical protein
MARTCATDSVCSSGSPIVSVRGPPSRPSSRARSETDALTSGTTNRRSGARVWTPAASSRTTCQSHGAWSGVSSTPTGSLGRTLATMTIASITVSAKSSAKVLTSRPPSPPSRRLRTSPPTITATVMKKKPARTTTARIARSLVMITPVGHAVPCDRSAHSINRRRTLAARPTTGRAEAASSSAPRRNTPQARIRCLR